MCDTDAEARGIARQARVALRNESARHEKRFLTTVLSGSLRNPKARMRWLTRMVNADPTIFLAVDLAQRSRDIDILMAWFVVMEEPQRLAVGSMTVHGSVRRGDINCPGISTWI